MRDICWPLGVLKTIVTSAMPATSDGLISAIFQVRSGFQPNIFFRNSLNVTSLGSGAVDAVEPAAVLAGAVPGCWAVEQRLASASVMINRMRRLRFMVPFVKRLVCLTTQRHGGTGEDCCPPHSVHSVRSAS